MDQITSQNSESLMHTGTAWFPEAAWSKAQAVDSLFSFILYGSIILFIAILIVMVYFLIRYKRSVTNLKSQGQMTHNTFLEISWTVIPLLLCAVVFVWGYRGFLDISTAPDDAMEVKVVAQKWSWQFNYPSGKISPSHLVVPVGQPVKLVMSSKDVLHSFYLPNFRVKRDVIPNRYTTVWFTGERLGTFQIFCTEYCGDGHSAMLAQVHVVEPDEYEKWIQGNEDDVPLVELGQRAVQSWACFACHSTDGTAGVGPTWKGLYGAKREFTDGSTTIADDNYIRESIQYPSRKIVKGPYGQMVSFIDKLSERQIDGIIEYIKTLK